MASAPPAAAGTGWRLRPPGPPPAPGAASGSSPLSSRSKRSPPQNQEPERPRAREQSFRLQGKWRSGSWKGKKPGDRDRGDCDPDEDLGGIGAANPATLTPSSRGGAAQGPGRRAARTCQQACPFPGLSYISMEILLIVPSLEKREWKQKF